MPRGHYIRMLPCRNIPTRKKLVIHQTLRKRLCGMFPYIARLAPDPGAFPPGIANRANVILHMACAGAAEIDARFRMQQQIGMRRCAHRSLFQRRAVSALGCLRSRRPGRLGGSHLCNRKLRRKRKFFRHRLARRLLFRQGLVWRIFRLCRRCAGDFRCGMGHGYAHERWANRR